MPLITLPPGPECIGPMEPGSRWDLEPCFIGPRAKLWRLIVPAKPLPREIPVASISSPAAKMSAVICWPTVYSEGADKRNSLTNFTGATPALSKWPFIGLVICFSLISPKPS